MSPGETAMLPPNDVLERLVSEVAAGFGASDQAITDLNNRVAQLEAQLTQHKDVLAEHGRQIKRLLHLCREMGIQNKELLTDSKQICEQLNLMSVRFEPLLSAMSGTSTDRPVLIRLAQAEQKLEHYATEQHKLNAVIESYEQRLYDASQQRRNRLWGLIGNFGQVVLGAILAILGGLLAAVWEQLTIAGKK